VVVSIKLVEQECLDYNLVFVGFEAKVVSATEVTYR